MPESKRSAAARRFFRRLEHEGHGAFDDIPTSEIPKKYRVTFERAARAQRTADEWWDKLSEEVQADIEEERDA